MVLIIVQSSGGPPISLQTSGSNSFSLWTFISLYLTPNGTWFEKQNIKRCHSVMKIDWNEWVWLSESSWHVLIHDESDGHCRHYFSQVGRDSLIEPSHAFMSAEEDIILITISMGALRIKTSILLLLTIWHEWGHDFKDVYLVFRHN